MQLLFIYPAVQCEDITMSCFNPDSFMMESIFALLLNGTLNLPANSVNHQAQSIGSALSFIVGSRYCIQRQVVTLNESITINIVWS
jgi:hypothetical protein